MPSDSFYAILSKSGSVCFLIFHVDALRAGFKSAVPIRSD